MKRLWAPWRMDYIVNAKEPGCFLCEAFQGEDDRGRLILHRGRVCAVVLNRYPYNSGHLMIAPYRHVGPLPELQPEERAEIMDLLAQSTEVLRKAYAPDGFNLGINLGEAAGAGLREHIHAHIVPRWNGDTNFMPVFGETKVLPQSLEETWDQLAPLFRADPRT